MQPPRLPRAQGQNAVQELLRCPREPGALTATLCHHKSVLELWQHEVGNGNGTEGTSRAGDEHQ